MQRSPIYYREQESWDNNVPRRREDYSDQQLEMIPKCPLPMLRPTRRMSQRRERDATIKYSNKSPSRYETIDKNFQRSFNNDSSALLLNNSARSFDDRKEESQMYPDLDISAQQFQNAKALAEVHRRRRSNRWQLASSARKSDQSGAATVTSPNPARRVRSVERCLQEFNNNQRSTTNQDSSILPPPQADGSPLGYNDVSQSSLFDSSPSISYNETTSRGEGGSYWAKEHQEPNSPESCKNTIVPSALDKSSVKRLAALHRQSSVKRLAARHRQSLCSTTSTNNTIRHCHSSGSSTTQTTPSSPCLTPPESPRTFSNQPATSTIPRPTPSVMVEICPGLSAPLRGSDETLKAVANRYYTDVTCFGCASPIYCIANVQWTICPHCRVISPLEEGSDAAEPEARWGLGLGFTKENLWNMQAEIAAERMVGY